MKRILTSSVLVLGLLLSAVPGQAQIFNRKTAEAEKHIEAVITAPGISEEVIQHAGYLVSYNPNLLIPNWVCWELTPKEAAAQDVSRTGEIFVPDPLVRGASAQDSDYRGSGFDRGHMAPAADMKWSEKAMTESFYLSNVCPQNRDLNAGLWLELEQKCRWWAKKYKTPVYIACGPVFTRDEARYIGANEVVVPDGFFKVVCQQRDGRWVAAGFVVPNANLKQDLKTLVTPLAVVEYLTGFKFFTNLPDGLHDSLSANVNPEDWDIPGWKTN